MSLEQPGFKTSDFQPTRPPESRHQSQFSVQTVRDAHQAAGRNAGQMGYPMVKNTVSMDQAYQSTPYVVKDGGAFGERRVRKIYPSSMEPFLHQHSRKRGATEPLMSTFAMQQYAKRSRMG